MVGSSKKITIFEKLKLEVVVLPETLQECIAALIVRLDLRERVISAQQQSEALEKKRLASRTGGPQEFREEADNALTFKGRLCVPDDPMLKEEILTEAHSTPYAAHPGSTRMYQDLRQSFCWEGMKNDVASHVQSVWCANK
ncbi:uncharacterized protein LOC130990893 [Salvia miltiorrhiza]|uniref:uncharacterized protein LOC130990893 n=1 Tax=Salvia miltiorrhiza TaxID=226208 RepID=UPI0025AC7DEC|nr:uncharacterized protein LOC130990893 [Salvia miltiorrhiza]